MDTTRGQRVRRRDGSEDDWFECFRCKRCYPRYPEILRHLLVRHSQDGSFPCYGCGRTFDNNFTRNDHQRSSGQCLKVRQNLKRYLGNYECRHCGKLYLNLVTYIKHLEVTPVCQRDFYKRKEKMNGESNDSGKNVDKEKLRMILIDATLKQRVSIRNRPRHQCRKCNAKFLMVYHAQRHEKKCYGFSQKHPYGGLRPKQAPKNSCKACGIDFLQKYALRSHLKAPSTCLTWLQAQEKEEQEEEEEEEWEEEDEEEEEEEWEEEEDEDEGEEGEEEEDEEGGKEEKAAENMVRKSIKVRGKQDLHKSQKSNAPQKSKENKKIQKRELVLKRKPVTLDVRKTGLRSAKEKTKGIKFKTVKSKSKKAPEKKSTSRTGKKSEGKGSLESDQSANRGSPIEEVGGEIHDSYEETLSESESVISDTTNDVQAARGRQEEARRSIYPMAQSLTKTQAWNRRISRNINQRARFLERSSSSEMSESEHESDSDDIPLHQRYADKKAQSPKPKDACSEVVKSKTAKSPAKKTTEVQREISSQIPVSIEVPDDLVCKICGKKCKTPRTYRHHMSFVHPWSRGDQIYKCIACGKRYCQNPSMYNHYLRSPKCKAKFEAFGAVKCPQCKITFVSHVSFLTHLTKNSKCLLRYKKDDEMVTPLVFSESSQSEDEQEKQNTAFRCEGCHNAFTEVHKLLQHRSICSELKKATHSSRPKPKMKNETEEKVLQKLADKRSRRLIEQAKKVVCLGCGVVYADTTYCNFHRRKHPECVEITKNLYKKYVVVYLPEVDQNETIEKLQNDPVPLWNIDMREDIFEAKKNQQMEESLENERDAIDKQGTNNETSQRKRSTAARKATPPNHNKGPNTRGTGSSTTTTSVPDDGKPDYRCKKCHRQFMSLWHYKRHVRGYPVCQFYYRSIGDIFWKVETIRQLYPCRTCHQVFATVGALNIHHMNAPACAEFLATEKQNQERQKKVGKVGGDPKCEAKPNNQVECDESFPESDMEKGPELKRKSTAEDKDENEEFLPKKRMRDEEMELEDSEKGPHKPVVEVQTAANQPKYSCPGCEQKFASRVLLSKHLRLCAMFTSIWEEGEGEEEVEEGVNGSANVSSDTLPPLEKLSDVNGKASEREDVMMEFGEELTADSDLTLFTEECEEAFESRETSDKNISNTDKKSSWSEPISSPSDWSEETMGANQKAEAFPVSKRKQVAVKSNQVDKADDVGVQSVPAGNTSNGLDNDSHIANQQGENCPSDQTLSPNAAGDGAREVRQTVQEPREKGCDNFGGEPRQVKNDNKTGGEPKPGFQASHISALRDIFRSVLRVQNTTLVNQTLPAPNLNQGELFTDPFDLEEVAPCSLCGKIHQLLGNCHGDE